TSYVMLFAFRALFGIGMGGEWAAAMPLVLEHWPTHLRGVASGILQGGYGWGTSCLHLHSSISIRTLTGGQNSVVGRCSGLACYQHCSCSGFGPGSARAQSGWSARSIWRSRKRRIRSHSFEFFVGTRSARQSRRRFFWRLSCSPSTRSCSGIPPFCWNRSCDRCGTWLQLFSAASLVASCGVDCRRRSLVAEVQPHLPRLSLW